MVDIAKVKVLPNFLDKETIERLKKDIFSSESNTLAQKKPELNFNTIGNAIEYLHHYTYGGSKHLLKENFINDSIKYNKQLSPKFDYLHNLLKKKLSEATGIPCDYKENILKPHIRIWSPKMLGDFRNNESGFHYDSNILFVDWEKYIGKKIENVISFTIAVEIPNYSEFEWVVGTETNDPKVYNSIDLNTSLYGKSKELPNHLKQNKRIHSYQEGDCVLQWNFTLHRIGKLGYSSFDQKRITIQGCGVHDGEKIWLSS